MTKHTPGPWKSRPRRDKSGTWWITVSQRWVGQELKEDYLVEVLPTLPEGTTEANARLIAEVPSLLKEGMALAMLVIQSDLYVRDPDVRDAVDNLLLIGAKAEGEQ